MARKPRAAFAVLVVLVVGAVVALQNSSKSKSPQQEDVSGFARNITPGAGTEPGVAVMIVVDTSGSMKEPTSGAGGPARSQVARMAFDSIERQCEAWAKKHPGVPLKVGLVSFSDKIRTWLELEPFDAQKLRRAFDSIPSPKGGTAIGSALVTAASQLSAQPLLQRHIFVLTDGENTVGPSPAPMAALIDDRTAGTLHLHFVAFDTDAKQFEFVKKTRGSSLRSATGKDLQSVVERTFTEILAEAPDESPPPVDPEGK